MAKKKPTSHAKAQDKRVSQLNKKLGLMSIEIGIYREIGGLAVKGSSRSSILNRLMDFALQALETDSGTLYLLDPENNELTFEVVKGPRAGRLKGLKMRARTGIAGLVAKTGKPHVSSDLAKDKHWAGIKFADSHTNMMAVPLTIKKKVVGVIEVLHKAGGQPFTRDDIKALTSIANHFAIIMERADLFSELDNRVRQFSILHDVGSLLVSTLDQSVVRHRAMEAITKIMSAETGSLLLVDDERQELYFEVALGEKGKTLKEVRLGMGEGIAGWVAKHGKPLIIDDVTQDRRFQGLMDKKSKFRTRNMICVPVEIKGKTIGVLQAINRLEGTFTKDDLRLFQLFSNQVAIALDNARLYEEIKETFHATSGALAESIEKRDPYTGGHTKRVLEYSTAIAMNLNLTADEIENVKLSAVLHDIGKIGIEDRILRKEAPLDASEAAQMKQHPQFGGEILKHVPQLKGIVPGMMYHHERVDGLGYPMGLKNGEIPLVAKIIAVADTYDAMTTTRPYRKGLPSEAAITEIRKCCGKQFDLKVVKAFLKAFASGEISHGGDEGSAHGAAATKTNRGTSNDMV